MEGDLRNSLRAPIAVVDEDGDPASAEVFVDDDLIQTVTLEGKRHEFEAEDEDLAIGEHRLRIDAYDREGNLGSTSARYEVGAVPTHAKLGMLPYDTLVTRGPNRRKILFWHEDSKPQRTIDEFNKAWGQGGRGFKWNETDLAVNLVLPEDRVLENGDTIPQEFIDSVYGAVTRGVEWANSVFRSVPRENPRTYNVVPGVVPEKPPFEEAIGSIAVFFTGDTGCPSIQEQGTHELGIVALYAHRPSKIFRTRPKTRPPLSRSQRRILPGRHTPDDHTLLGGHVHPLQR